jgi:DNA-binding MurR/RpiR family transcriptional regulator
MPISRENSNPLSDLRRRLPGLPDRLRDVGRYVAEHEFDATTRSMRELASSANLQPAAFTRLAQALGRPGWEEFRNQLIEARRPTNQNPYSSRVGPGSLASEPPDDPTPLVGVIQAADVDSVAKIDVRSITPAVRALHAAPRIWIAGYRSCRSVAQLLHYQLRLFRENVHWIGALGSEDLDFGEFRKEDAVIITSFAPYTKVGLSTVRAARKAGCILVSITDHPTSPYAEGADHCIVYNAAATPAFFPSLTAAVYVAQAIAAGMFKLGGDRAAARLRDSEARLTDLDCYISSEVK